MKTKDCGNPKCTTKIANRKKYCSIACVHAWNRGFPEPLPVEGATWIELGAHRWSLVDNCDAAIVSAQGFWSRSSSRGRRIAHRYGGSGEFVKLHRFIMQQVLGGQIPEGATVDHVNCDPLDNRRSNLRLATAREQCINRRSVSTITGLRGIYQTPHGRYVALLQVGGRRMYLGTFKLLSDASKAYDDAARAAHKSFARLNDPKPHEQSATSVDAQIDERLMTG